MTQAKKGKVAEQAVNYLGKTIRERIVSYGDNGFNEAKTDLTMESGRIYRVFNARMPSELTDERDNWINQEVDLSGEEYVTARGRFCGWKVTAVLPIVEERVV